MPLTQARLVLKARPSTHTLVVKLTDDHVVRRPPDQTLKYRAKSAIILNRLDEFQRELFESMSGVHAPVDAAVAAPAPADTPAPAPAKSKSKKKGKKK